MSRASALTVESQADRQTNADWKTSEIAVYSSNVQQAQEGNSRVRLEMTNKRLRDMYWYNTNTISIQYRYNTISIYWYNTNTIPMQYRYNTITIWYNTILYPKYPEIPVNYQKYPKIPKYIQKYPKIPKNSWNYHLRKYQNVRKCWKM